MADGGGGPAGRAEPLDLIKGEFRAGGDYQIIIGDGTAIVELKLVLVGMDAFYAGGNEVDTLALQIGARRGLDLLAFAPFHGNPRVGWDEMKVLAVRDDSNLVAFVQLVPHFISRRHTADPRSHNDYMCHVCS